MGVNLSATLPDLLKAKRMTQDQLAEKTGIRRTDINALARGRIEAGTGRLEKIAQALAVSPLELGAPLEGADESDTLPQLLESLRATVEAQDKTIASHRGSIRKLQSRVRVLEQALGIAQTASEGR